MSRVTTNRNNNCLILSFWKHQTSVVKREREDPSLSFQTGVNLNVRSKSWQLESDKSGFKIRNFIENISMFEYLVHQ